MNRWQKSENFSFIREEFVVGGIWRNVEKLLVNRDILDKDSNFDKSDRLMNIKRNIFKDKIADYIINQVTIWESIAGSKKQKAKDVSRRLIIEGILGKEEEGNTQMFNLFEQIYLRYETGLKEID